jgi:hypothetical protein
LGGLIRIGNYELSSWILNSAFVPYFIVRSVFYLTRRRRLTPVEKYRLAVLAIIFTIVLLNFFAVYRIEFLLLILLMIDYLLVARTDNRT